MLPKTSAYIKSYDSETRYFFFPVEDYELLENMMTFRMKSAIE